MYIRRKVFSLGEGNIDYDYNLYQALYSDYEDDYFDPTYDEIERFYSDSFDEGFDFYVQKMFGEFHEGDYRSKRIAELEKQGIRGKKAWNQINEEIKNIRSKIEAGQTVTGSRKKASKSNVDRLAKKEEGYISNLKLSDQGREKIRKMKADLAARQDKGILAKLTYAGNVRREEDELVENLQKNTPDLYNYVRENKNQRMKDIGTMASQKGQINSMSTELEQLGNKYAATEKDRQALIEQLAREQEEHGLTKGVLDATNRQNKLKIDALTSDLDNTKKAAEEAAKQAKAKQEGLEKSLKKWKVGAGIGAGVAGLGGLGAYLYNRNKDR